MQVVINLIIKFFAITLLGLGLKKYGMINETLEKGMNRLLLEVVLPLNILVSSQSQYSSAAVNGMVKTAFLAGGYYILAIIGSIAISKISGMSEKGKRVFIGATVFGNVGFIGFPVASELYGPEGVLYAVVYNIFFLLFFFTYGIAVLTGEKNFNLLVAFKKPVMICSVLSIVFFVFQIPIQEGLADGMRSVGNMTAPISLILIGASLANEKIKYILLDKNAYLISFVRMVLYPSLFFVVMLKLNLPTIVAGTGAVLTALPSGSLTFMYAKEYDCDPQFASRSIVQTMLVMAITLPLILIFVNLYL